MNEKAYELENSELFMNSITEEEEGKRKCYDFSWIINNYDTIKCDEVYRSYVIYIGKNHHRLCFKRETQNSSIGRRKQVKIRLYLDPEVGKDINLQFAVKDYLGKNYQLELAPCYSDIHFIMEKPCMIYKARLEVSFKISVSNNDDSKRNIVATSTPFKKYRHNSEWMHDLFVSGKFSDLKVVVGDKEFDVHRNILALRSPIFATMLETNMKEKEESKIVIEDCDSKIFREFLLYIYTGKLEPFSAESALSLYQLSEKYGLEELKSDSINLLCYKVSMCNIVEVYKLAHLHQDSRLKLAVIDFAVSNIQVLMEAPEWKTLCAFDDNFVDAIMPILVKHAAAHISQCEDYRPYNRVPTHREYQGDQDYLKK